MNSFTIRDIENLSGIKAHTWRIWEQRYSIDISRRTKTNQRCYDNENLKEVLRISYLYHSGIKMSKIARYTTEQIREKSLEIFTKDNEYTWYVTQLTEAAIDLDEIKFETIIAAALLNLGVQDAMIKVVYTFQEKIGQLWLTDHLVPAQEHFTSNIIRRKLANATEALPLADPVGKTIILYAPEKEYHEIPLQLIHFMLRKNNINVIYFGCNMPVRNLLDYFQKCDVNTLFFNLVTELKTKADAYLHKLSKLFPEKKIIMSGPITASVTVNLKNVKLLKSMNEIVEFCNEG